MSSLSDKNEGYTSPDFLTNLFSKPLYSPLSLTSIPSSSSSDPNKQNNTATSLSLIDPPTSLHRPHKMFRMSSVYEEEKVNSKKYKIFMKTFMMGRGEEEEDIDCIWDQLEEVMNNPYAFDRFIEEVKGKREKSIEGVKKKGKQGQRGGRGNRVSEVGERKRRRSIQAVPNSALNSVCFASPQKPLKQVPTSIKDTTLPTFASKAVAAATKASIRRQISSIKQLLLTSTHALVKKR